MKLLDQYFLTGEVLFGIRTFIVQISPIIRNENVIFVGGQIILWIHDIATIVRVFVSPKIDQ